MRGGKNLQNLVFENIVIFHMYKKRNVLPDFYTWWNKIGATKKKSFYWFEWLMEVWIVYFIKTYDEIYIVYKTYSPLGKKYLNIPDKFNFLSLKFNRHVYFIQKQISVIKLSKI